MSSIKKIIRGTVKRGKFIPADPTAFRLVFCAHEGKAVDVTVARYRKSRSNNQNSYYYGVVIPLIAETTGYSNEEAHEALKMKFLGIEKNGLKSCGSTTKLNTKEFEDLMTSIRQWAAADLDCHIPLPNEIDI